MIIFTCRCRTFSKSKIKNSIDKNFCYNINKDDLRSSVVLKALIFIMTLKINHLLNICCNKIEIIDKILNVITIPLQLL